MTSPSEATRGPDSHVPLLGFLANFFTRTRLCTPLPRDPAAAARMRVEKKRTRVTKRAMGAESDGGSGAQLDVLRREGLMELVPLRNEMQCRPCAIP